jgi:cyclopropane-fatty-acyl-phospholipid synthase
MNNLFNKKFTESKQTSHFDALNIKLHDKRLRLCTELLHIIFKDYKGRVSIRLWNDEVVIGSRAAVCTLVFNQPYSLSDLLLNRDLNRLAEAYLYGDVDAEGNLEMLFGLVEYLQNRFFTLAERLRIFLLALKVASDGRKRGLISSDIGAERNSNTKDSIAHHYDISNEFYRLFLDPEMVYSCAYFSSPEQSLAAAQRDKLDYICRKLRLVPGQKLLDIGCGWGGLSLWAARNYGVNVHAITLSQKQYSYAVARACDLKLDNRVNFELRDYRELPDSARYDRIVSVGMFEHIGTDNFPVYFKTIKRLLKSDGLFLNHGITNDTGWQRTPITLFINKYIFPDGELARISEVTTAMEKAGFEILDTEALRPHYVLTLRNWVSELDKNRDKAIDIAGEMIYKLWRLYMAGSVYYFNEGNTGVYQILACKQHQPWLLPLRRDDLYMFN